MIFITLIANYSPLLQSISDLLHWIQLEIGGKMGDSLFLIPGLPKQPVSKNAKDSMDKEKHENDELSIENLPSELLLHICSFLDAKTVITSLSCVCKTFHHILTDYLFWKVRIRKRWPKKYPPIPVNDSVFDWRKACIDREECSKTWSDVATNMDYILYSDVIFAPVDGIHIMEGDLIAAGSRDRYLNVIDSSKLDVEKPSSKKEAVVLSQMNAHKGWIWTISSLGSMLATGSWDKYIKFWDIENGGVEVRNVKTNSAVLCSSYTPNLYVAGGYNQYIYHIDPRVPVIISKKHYHKRSVLCLNRDDNYIISGSEDSTISVFDLRADQVLKSITLEEYPIDLSYHGDMLWAGDKKGYIHLFDATDGDFNLIDTYDIGHKGKITGIIYTPGAMFTCSTDKTIRVLEPSLNPASLTVLNQDAKPEISSIDYRRGILASANADYSIGIWRPKKNCDTL